MLGQGVERDFDKAVGHFRKGVEAGDPFAHVTLSHCYMYGNGVEQSYEKAFHLNRRASETSAQPGLLCYSALDLYSV